MVLPTLAVCTTNPATPGCSVVLPDTTDENRELFPAAIQIVKDIAKIIISPVAPPGLVLISLVKSEDDATSLQTGTPGDSSSKEKEIASKDKEKEQQESSGDNKDAKPKKNYCPNY